MTAPAGAQHYEDYWRLIEQSVGEVHRFVRQRVPHRADAQDIAQQTLFQACANLGTFRGGNFHAWLQTIARRLIVDHYRTRNRFEFLQADTLALLEAEPALRTAADAVPVRCDRRGKLCAWVDCLTHRLRLEEQVAVLLADIHGYRDKDSAAELAMRLSTFKLLLHAARARLHEIAGGKCNIAGPTQPAAAEAAGPAPGTDSCPVQGCGNGRPTPAHTCCSGIARCVSESCSVGTKCRQGIRCCLQVPKLLALRDRLLAVFQTS